MVEVVAAPAGDQRLGEIPEEAVPRPRGAAGAQEDAREHAADVGVEHRDVLAVREREHGARGVAADAGQAAQILRPVGQPPAGAPDRNLAMELVRVTELEKKGGASKAQVEKAEADAFERLRIDLLAGPVGRSSSILPSGAMVSAGCTC